MSLSRVYFPKKTKPILSFSLLVTAINVVFLIVGIVHCPQSDYDIMIVLPAAFTVLFEVVRTRIVLTEPGIFMLNLISFMRFSVTPTVLIVLNKLNAFVTTKDYLVPAVLIMLFEMAFVYITILLYHPQLKKTNISVSNKTNSLIIPKILIAFTVIILSVINKTSIGTLSIFGEAKVSQDFSLGSQSGLVTMIWQASCALLFSFLIFDISQTKKRTGKVVISLLLSILYLWVIYTGQATISRWYTIVTFIAIAFWLVKLYPKNKKAIFIYMGIPVVVILFIATVIKNTSDGFGGSIKETLNSIFSPTNLDTYFAGPSNVNAAIAVKESGKLTIRSCFYDLFNNFPILNHYVARENASVHIFNSFLNRNDQIIPLVGQSFGWFGYLFSPLLSVFSVVLTKKCDLRFRHSSNIKAFLFAFTGIWCSTMMILNVTIWISWLYSRIIPAFIFFGVYHMFCFRKERTKTSIQVAKEL